MTSRRLLTTTSRILLDAADYMEKHGFCKRTLQDDHGRVCALGAIWMVTYGTLFPKGDQTAHEGATSALMDHLHRSHECINIAGWNNAKKRTAEEVIGALRSAALSDYALKAV